MRSPGRKRPLARKVSGIPHGVDASSVAARVRYVGSPEHKTYPFAGSSPRLRADASKCDKVFVGSESELTEWLREAIRRGVTGGQWEGGFPKYVWHREGDVVYEARLLNCGNGEYKGYPLTQEQYPEGL